MKRLLSFVILFSFLIPSVFADKKEDFALAKSWGIQLQNIDIDELIDTDFDILVIDYSQDGTLNGEFTKEQIQKLKDSGKVVLAYLSIGEAEIYRFYWQAEWEATSAEQDCTKSYWDEKKGIYTWKNICPYGKAPFLGWENTNWHGNFAVKYWYPAWWEQALKVYLDKIVAAGFDGVYLDKIDVYEEWADYGYNVKSLSDRMVVLIGKIYNYLHVDKKNSEFLIVPQNSLNLVNQLSTNTKKKYFMWTNGVGIEDLFYNTDKKSKIINLRKLQEFAKNNQKILNVEYFDKKSTLTNYLKLIKGVNFEILPYQAASDAELNEIMKPLVSDFASLKDK